MAYQFGFRSCLGAADLLTALNREWLTSINTRGAIGVLAVDIAVAFDKVSHAGVLHKLSSYGVGGSLHRWSPTTFPTERYRSLLAVLPSNPSQLPLGYPKETSLAQPSSLSTLTMLQTFYLTACTQPYTVTTRSFTPLCHLPSHLRLNAKNSKWASTTWHTGVQRGRSNSSLQNRRQWLSLVTKTTGSSLQSASMATLSTRWTPRGSWESPLTDT